MSGKLNKHWGLVSLRVLVGAVFLYASVVKIQSPQTFTDSIASFRLLPVELINLFTLTLLPLEFAVGLLLVVGFWKRLASFAVLVLCGIFILALVSARMRNLEVDCGCFGAGKPSVWETWLALGRDTLLLCAARVLYRHEVTQSVEQEMVSAQRTF